jgi:hypothetical protein
MYPCQKPWHFPNGRFGIFLMAARVQRQQLGTMRLYHATSNIAGSMIVLDGWMRAGESGMFGAAVYFADSERAARYKTRHGCDFIIIADVDMGCALVLETPANHLTLSIARTHGCDTVKGRSRASAAWEYAVFEPYRITLVSSPSTPNLGPPTCSYARHGAQYIAQPWYHCRTCGLVGDRGCCQACFKRCHSGHDAFFDGNSRASYCDCGADHKCQLVTSGVSICTYASHGAEYIDQPWYHCRTCGLVGNLGCCQGCFEACHRGHDAFFEKRGQAC